MSACSIAKYVIDHGDVYDDTKFRLQIWYDATGEHKCISEWSFNCPQPSIKQLEAYDNEEAREIYQKALFEKQLNKYKNDPVMEEYVLHLIKKYVDNRYIKKQRPQGFKEITK